MKSLLLSKSLLFRGVSIINWRDVCVVLLGHRWLGFGFGAEDPYYIMLDLHSQAHRELCIVKVEERLLNVIHQSISCFICSTTCMSCLPASFCRQHSLFCISIFAQLKINTSRWNKIDQTWECLMGPPRDKLFQKAQQAVFAVLIFQDPCHVEYWASYSLTGHNDISVLCSRGIWVYVYPKLYQFMFFFG